MAASKVKIRIRLKGYDHNLVDQAAEKIVDTAKRTGRSGERSHPASHREGSCYHPACCTQVQGQP